MPKVRDVARVTTRLSRTAETVEERSQLVYVRMRQLAEGSGSRARFGDLDGWRWEGVMKTIIYNLWPEINQSDEKFRHDFYEEIRLELSDTDNARCIVPRPGNSRLPVWWVRDQYNETKTRSPRLRSVSVPERQPDAIDRRAAKLTPEEAGETRQPEPVTVTQLPTSEGPAMSGQSAAKPKADELLTPVLDLLAKHPSQPLTSTEIAFVLGQLVPAPSRKDSGKPSKRPVASAVLGDALRTLCSRRKIYRRLETYTERKIRAGLAEGESPSGRLGFLYSLKKPVPTRTQCVVVPGYRLETPPMPKDAGAKHMREMADARNDRVLNAIIEVGRPINVHTVVKVTGLTRGRAEASIRALLDGGLIHAGRSKRTGREYLPIDIPFGAATPPQAAKKEENAVVTLPNGANGTTLGVLRAAEDLTAAGRDFTAVELAEASGRHDSTVRTVMNSHPHLFKWTGKSRRRSHVYVYLGAAQAAPSQPEKTEQKETKVATPPTAAQPQSSLVDIVNTAVDSFRQSLEQIVTVASQSSPEQDARVRELEERNDRLQEKLRRLIED